jgi:hypothetical protein
VAALFDDPAASQCDDCQARSNGGELLPGPHARAALGQLAQQALLVPNRLHDLAQAGECEVSTLSAAVRWPSPNERLGSSVAVCGRLLALWLDAHRVARFALRAVRARRARANGVAELLLSGQDELTDYAGGGNEHEGRVARPSCEPLDI